MGKSALTVFLVLAFFGSAYGQFADEEGVTDVVFTDIGAGIYVNTINLSVGPTLIVWPLEDFGFQATYGVGLFTSYEARLLYRINVSENHNFYLGAGYLHVEKEAEVLDVTTKITGNGTNIFAGMERALFRMDPLKRNRRKLFFYLEFSKPFISIEKEVDTSAGRKKATVDYSPFSIGTGLAYYPF